LSRFRGRCEKRHGAHCGRRIKDSTKRKKAAPPQRVQRPGLGRRHEIWFEDPADGRARLFKLAISLSDPCNIWYRFDQIGKVEGIRLGAVEAPETGNFAAPESDYGAAERRTKGSAFVGSANGFEKNVCAIVPEGIGSRDDAEVASGFVRGHCTVRTRLHVQE
jgi:hypothetical protein